jgi:hypothetical protein
MNGNRARKAHSFFLNEDFKNLLESELCFITYEKKMRIVFSFRPSKFLF